ncbi:MAG: hypothetical protein KKI08_11240 [Armatimonadetes bacterium]|nr:hypothetical protein [Armatimonadota bacterium]
MSTIRPLTARELEMAASAVSPAALASAQCAIDVIALPGVVEHIDWLDRYCRAGELAYFRSVADEWQNRPEDERPLFLWLVYKVYPDLVLSKLVTGGSPEIQCPEVWFEGWPDGSVIVTTRPDRSSRCLSPEPDIARVLEHALSPVLRRQTERMGTEPEDVLADAQAAVWEFLRKKSEDGDRDWGMGLLVTVADRALIGHYKLQEKAAVAVTVEPLDEWLDRCESGSRHEFAGSGPLTPEQILDVQADPKRTEHYSAMTLQLRPSELDLLDAVLEHMGETGEVPTGRQLAQRRGITEGAARQRWYEIRKTFERMMCDHYPPSVTTPSKKASDKSPGGS